MDLGSEVSMKLLFKQRFFSWFDSYNIYYLPDGMSADDFDYDEAHTAFRVEGQLAWGHSFRVYDRDGRELARLEQEVFTFLAKFDIEIGGQQIGRVEREFSFFSPRYTIDFRGWQVEGDIFGWDYSITDERGKKVASVTKELFHFTDTYVIDIPDERDSLCALMVVLAIDADKCSK